ncbi:hypothetical protein [uncultured Chryseobacterium sp.]|uniref:hypothetical protein n=1 Tax=uncultured Chryseobacterium sp. TaxID=259322 RepID=UPI0025EDB2D7|nr:hypothetical protein [uncultured Chryseobacterium sp.]
MSEKLNINDFKSDRGDISRLESNEGNIKRLESDGGNINILTVELLKLKKQIELLSNELKIVKDGRELIRITAEKTEIKNRLYANNEYVSVPIGTVVAFAGKEIPWGWELCDGSEIDWRNSDAIRIIGRRKPNLINKFIRGTNSDAVREGGSDEMRLTAENLPWHNHAYYETRFNVGTKWGTRGIDNNDALYHSHDYYFVKRLTNNDMDSDDHRPSRLDARSFSIIPSHITLRYIIKLM